MQLVDLLSTINRPLILVLLGLGFAIGSGAFLYRTLRSRPHADDGSAGPASRRAKGLALLLGTIPMGCCLAGGLLFLVLVLDGYKPIPPAYPGATVHHTYTGVGSWGYTEFYTYTVELPLVEMEQYYAQQMSKYCAEWTSGFEDAPDYYDYPSCRETACPIPRRRFEHYFSVVLCPMSEKKTWVSYVNAHEEP